MLKSLEAAAALAGRVDALLTRDEGHRASRVLCKVEAAVRSFGRLLRLLQGRHSIPGPLHGTLLAEVRGIRGDVRARHQPLRASGRGQQRRH